MQAAAEAPLEHEWDATRFKPVHPSFCEPLVRLHSSSSDSLSVMTVSRSDLLAILGLPNNPERFSVTSFWHLQSSFASAQENISSARKAEFLIWLKGVNFWGFIFCGLFFSAGTNFCRLRSIRKIHKNLNPQNFHAMRFWIVDRDEVVSFLLSRKTNSSFSSLFWINNKAIIKFSFGKIWRILQTLEGVIHLGLRLRWITATLICRILNILLGLIQ